MGIDLLDYIVETTKLNEVNLKTVYKLLPILFTSFSAPLFGSGYLTLIGFVQNDLNVSLFQIGLTISLYALPFTLIQLFSGSLGDLTKRKLLLQIGAVLFVLGSFVAASSVTFLELLLARFILGISSAILMPLSLVVLADSIVDEARGRVVGMYGTMTSFGVFSGPLIAGIVNSVFGWRGFFVISMTYGVILFFWLSFYNVKESEIKRTKSIRETLKESVVITFKVGQFAALQVIAFIGFVGFFMLIGLITFTSSYLQGIGVQSELIGLMISAVGFSGVLFSFSGGWLVDKIGRTQTVRIGAFGIVFSFFFLFFGYKISFIVLFFGMFLFGLFLSFLWAGLNTLATEVVPSQRGAATSFYSFFRNLGQIMAPLLFEPVYSLFSLQGIFLSGFMLFLVVFFLTFPLSAMKKEKNEI